MSLAGRKRRRRSEIRQKRKRHVKLRKLAARLKAATSESDRGQVVAKIRKLVPTYQLQK
ncbi:MAG TPA: hypothetical protein PLL75_04540 [Candidatus Omnitrophota bacterium]|nr:hypothetical protein [Candidatus Omnitrophota bacterium]HPS36979.1 hypothetical protein [Candidatus Omnitrophota bacterium]